MDLHAKLAQYQSTPRVQPESKDLWAQFKEAAGDGSSAPFISMLEKLGFEKVGEFYRDHSENYSIGKEEREIYSKDPVYVFARPDGIVVSWDTYNGSMQRAKWLFQWIPDQGVEPFFADDAHREFLSMYTPIHDLMTGDGTHFMQAQTDCLKSPALANILEYLGKHGKFQSPFLDKPGALIRLPGVLTSSSDFHHQENVSRLNRFPRGTSVEVQRIVREQTDHAVAHMVKQVAEIRILKLPLWVRQMIGAEPLPSAPVVSPAPAASTEPT